MVPSTSKLNQAWLLEPKSSGGGRGVKDKNLSAWNIKVVKDGAVPSVMGDSKNAALEVVLPSVVDEDVSKEQQIPVVNTNHLGSYPPLPTSMDGLDAMLENVWVKLHGVRVTTFSKDGLSAIATKLGTPIMLDSYTSDMYMQSCDRSSDARVMIELRADVELKDNIVVAMPKIIKEGHYICDGEKETLKKPSQTSRGVPVGLKMGFKPQKEYRLVTKKPTASSSGNKKKGVVPTIEVSNSNPFEVLNSVDNDVELGTNRGTTNLVNNEATLIGSSFMNIDNSSTRTTLIIDKIRKFEELLTSGKDTLVDEDDNPLKKVKYPDDYDSEDEVALVDNDIPYSMASERVGFGTQSLLEQ
ncbi:hypothetical protein Tco_1530984 [Tanacetum coccineum]